MATNSKDPTANNNDDPRQAMEEGDPKVTGRSPGRVAEDQQIEDAGRTNPDALRQSGKKDASEATPHLESGDR